MRWRGNDRSPSGSGRAAGALLGALLLGALWGAAPVGAAPSSTLKHFRSADLSFDYPASWHAVVPGLGQQPPPDAGHRFVWLSDQPLRFCPGRSGGSGSSGAPRAAAPCSTLPVGSLRRNGVLVLWSSTGFIRWTLARAPGGPRTVGGRPAKELVAAGRGDACPLGTAEHVEVQAARSSPNSAFVMTACLAGPRTAASLAEVQAMLASTRFTS